MNVCVWFSIFVCLIWYQMLAAESISRKLLFASTHSIMEVDIDTQIVVILVAKGESLVYSMDYDYENRYVYFPRISIGDIVRFPYPSANRSLQRVVHTSQRPVGVAVDSANDHIYWVNDYGNTLSRCKSDGTNIVVYQSLVNTFMIRLDLTNRWMYIGYHTSGISKSRFDLSELSFIANFTSSQIWVVCMDLDITEHKLYWISFGGDIKCVNDDGSDVNIIISTNSPKRHYAMGVLGSNIFYADNNRIIMRNKSQDSTPIVLYTDTIKIYSMFVFNQIDKCSPNSCQNNGSCTNVKDGYTCTCTTGWKGKNCTIGLTNAINVPKSRSTGAVVGAIVGSLLFICMVFVSIYIGRRFLWCTKSKENSINNPETNEHIANKAITLSQVSDPAHEHAQYEELHTQSGDRTYYNSSTNNHLQNSSNHDYDYPDMVNYGYENLSDKTSTTEY